MKKILAEVVIVMVSLFMLSTSTVLAQIDYCEGNFDYDKDVDGGDAALFKSDFGRSQFSNPCPPDGPAPVPRTGATGCWDQNGDPILCAYSIGDENVVLHGQDGAWRKGAEWPDPRFTDNGDGTVTDNLTGLIWLKHASCLGLRTWGQAIDDCDGLSAGYCGLIDGSVAGDWRLPNYRELFSLVDASRIGPAIPQVHPFTNVQPYYYYWSSTNYAWDKTKAWGLFLMEGELTRSDKTEDYYVWPVRGGQ